MLSLGVVIALSACSTVSLSMHEIDSYVVEKWYNNYNVKLLSSNDTELGSISLYIPDNRDESYSVGVFIDDDRYVAIITENDAGDMATAEFRQHGETIGWIDIVKDHNGNIRLRGVSPSLEQFEMSFELAMAISEDPAMIRKLRNPIHIDSISGDEGFWCGVGTMGASYVLTPAGGFFYAVTCGLFAGMDSWGTYGGVSSGGFSSGGGSSSGDPCRGHGCGYKVVRIWRHI